MNRLRITRSELVYPRDHQVGMKVPVGGSNCLKCKFVRYELDGQHCANVDFQLWNESSRLPYDATIYCCDFYKEDK